MDAGTFTCELPYCPKSGFPCSFCEMPEPDQKALYYVGLYDKCKSMKVLPKAGGLFDQDDEIMTAFHVIDERIAIYKRNKEWEMQRKLEIERIQSLG